MKEPRPYKQYTQHNTDITIATHTLALSPFLSVNSLSLVPLLLPPFPPARAHYQAGLKIDPEDKGCIDGYKLSKAILKAKDQGDAAMAENRWADAATLFQEASNLDTNVGVWVRESLIKLATSRWRHKDLPAAKHAAEHLIRLNDGIAEAHHVLAEVLMLMEQWEEANREAQR